jgi:putative 4-mercaptohistidine N1-methyltranferase
VNIYETPKLLAEYLLFHYGTEEEVLPWAFGPREALGFAVRSVTKLLDEKRVPAQARALDLGCAVGRSSYELARVCEEVLAIDYSQSFVDAAERVRDAGEMRYPRLDEGLAKTELTAARPAEGDKKRIRFEQGDAMNLREDLGGFDVVHAANLLCRLSEPQRLLDRLPALVKPGGQLLLTTPCTWLEEFTPPERWPQGSTLEWLQEKLAPHFTLELREDLPFLIREHARKFQWSVALGMRWLRVRSEK